MAKNRVDLGCKQLRGSFVITGKITGRSSASFYSEGYGSNGHPWRRVHFGVEIEPKKAIYCDIFGSVQDNVYFASTATDGSGHRSNETISVPWAKRFEKQQDYRLIGITCGCKKVVNKKGQEVNDVRYLTAYDACDEIGNLQDGDSVYVRGNITYSTYRDQHRVNFEPTQISLCKPVDFEAPGYRPSAQFTQPIVLMGVNKNPENPAEAIVSAKIVNYQTIEDTELYVRNTGLARNLKGLKDYVHIKVWGDIVVDGELAEAKPVDNGWGTDNRMERVLTPFARKLVITGADPDTIDRDAYSESVIDHALEVIASIQNARNDYGQSGGNWGGKGNFADGEEDDLDLGI